jgi:hypothetical protein
MLTPVRYVVLAIFILVRTSLSLPSFIPLINLKRHRLLSTTF